MAGLTGPRRLAAWAQLRRPLAYGRPYDVVGHDGLAAPRRDNAYQGLGAVLERAASYQLRLRFIAALSHGVMVLEALVCGSAPGTVPAAPRLGSR